MRDLIDILNETTLNEVEYQHRTPLWQDIQPYLGKGLFIHFGETPKVGIKPTGYRIGGATDPVGIYFYQLDWLASSERFKEGEQYATTFPYWTIVSLNTGQPGITLSKLTVAEVEMLADQNAWPTDGVLSWPEFKKAHADKSAAELFWHYMRALGHQRQFDGFSHVAALRGVSYIWDDGLGIVHSYEPNQLITFSPAAYDVVASGEQTTFDDGRFDGQRYPFIEMLKIIRGKFGGEITWNEKLPQLTINHQGAAFAISWKSGWDSYARIAVTWGRAEESFTYKGDQFKRGTMEQAVDFFSNIITKYGLLAKAKKDIFFQPSITEQAAKQGIAALIADQTSFRWNTEISNRNKMMRVEASKETDVGNPLTSRVYCLNEPDNVSFAVQLKIGYHTLTQGKVGANADDLLNTLVRYFDQHIEGIAPGSDGYRKFYHEDDFRAFKGMVALESGVTVLQEHYADEIALWQGYPHQKDVYDRVKAIY